MSAAADSCIRRNEPAASANTRGSGRARAVAICSSVLALGCSVAAQWAGEHAFKIAADRLFVRQQDGKLIWRHAAAQPRLMTHGSVMLDAVAVSCMAEIAAGRYVVAVRGAANSRIHEVVFERGELRDVQRVDLPSITPGRIAVHPTSRDVFVADLQLRQVHVGHWQDGSLPKAWVLVADHKSCPILDDRFVQLESDRDGVYAVVRYAVADPSQIRYGFHYQAGQWQTTPRHVSLVPQPQPYLEHSEHPLVSADHMQLRVSHPGTLLMERRGEGSVVIDRISPERVGRWFEVRLPTPMAFGQAYRLLLQRDGAGEPLCGHWFWPTYRAGVSQAFGAIAMQRPSVLPQRCRVGGASYGITATFESVASPNAPPTEAELIFWYAIRPATEPPPLISQGSLVLLRTDASMRMSVTALQPGKPRTVTYGFPIADDAGQVGKVLYGQVVVRTITGDLAVTEVVGSQILPATPTRPIERTIRQHVERWWANHSVTGRREFEADLRDELLRRHRSR